VKKKSIPSLILFLLLSLTVCPLAHADSRRNGQVNNLVKLAPQLQQELPSVISSFLFLDAGSKETPATAAQVLKLSDSLADRFFSSWNPTVSFPETQHPVSVAKNTLEVFDEKYAGIDDCMAISLHRAVGNKKIWSVSLNLGVTIQKSHIVEPKDGFSEILFPKLPMDANDQRNDVFDQIRNAAPVIGFGISCRF
jgi:hypothetical protein